MACDYTLIGEELFAASGLVAKDPAVAAAVWGQDWIRYVIIASLLTGGVVFAIWGFNLGAWLTG